MGVATPFLEHLDNRIALIKTLGGKSPPPKRRRVAREENIEYYDEAYPTVVRPLLVKNDNYTVKRC